MKKDHKRYNYKVYNVSLIALYKYQIYNRVRQIRFILHILKDIYQREEDKSSVFH